MTGYVHGFPGDEKDTSGNERIDISGSDGGRRDAKRSGYVDGETAVTAEGEEMEEGPAWSSKVDICIKSPGIVASSHLSKDSSMAA